MMMMMMMMMNIRRKLVASNIFVVIKLTKVLKQCDKNITSELKGQLVSYVCVDVNSLISIFHHYVDVDSLISNTMNRAI